jgi:hypothetical protein
LETLKQQVSEFSDKCLNLENELAGEKENIESIKEKAKSILSEKDNEIIEVKDKAKEIVANYK